MAGGCRAADNGMGPLLLITVGAAMLVILGLNRAWVRELLGAVRG